MDIFCGANRMTNQDIDWANVHPYRADVSWGYDSRRANPSSQERQAVVFIRKKFSRVERIVRRVLGGADYLQRPMDTIMTVLWELCDGKTPFAEICTILDHQFKEDIAPVGERSIAAVSELARLGLLTLHQGPVQDPENRHPKLVENEDYDWLAISFEEE